VGQGGLDTAAVSRDAEDPAYPDTTPPDSVFPCRTLEAIGPPLDGIATPSVWSELESPLTRALDELWIGLGLLRRFRPERWISIHFGRIAVNAHGWERLCARLDARDADPALVAPPTSRVERWIDAYERWRAGVSRSGLASRVERAERNAERELLRARGQDPRQLDASEVARGPLRDGAWVDVLMPWLVARACAEEAESAEDRLRAGVLLEQRFGTELGRRLASRGVLGSPVQVAYLTRSERMLAVHDASRSWSSLAAARSARIESWVQLEVPERFWGGPRVTRAKRR
jgi:hypothetical protein